MSETETNLLAPQELEALRTENAARIGMQLRAALQCIERLLETGPWDHPTLTRLSRVARDLAAADTEMVRATYLTQQGRDPHDG